VSVRCSIRVKLEAAKELQVKLPPAQDQAALLPEKEKRGMVEQIKERINAEVDGGWHPGHPLPRELATVAVKEVKVRMSKHLALNASSPRQDEGCCVCQEAGSVKT
jgi:hypothetical protein